MKIKLVMFAAAKEHTGHDQLELDLEPGSTIGAVKKQLKDRWPALNDLVARSAFAVNEAYSMDSQTISEGDEIGWIPPVSGG